MARERHLLRHLALIAVSVLVALGLAEAGLRLFYPWPFYSRGTTVRFDPLTGWIFKPNLRAHSTNQYREYITGFNTNSTGFRDTEFSIRPAGGAFVALGDSYTVAREVLPRRRWPERLAAALSSRLPRPIRALNFGCDGYSPTQEMLVYQKYARKYPHRLVVVLFYCGNDFSDTVGNRNTPFLRPTPRGFELVTPKDPTLIVKRWNGRPPWYKKLHLYNWQRDLMAGWRLKSKWAAKQKKWDGSWEGFWRTYRHAFTVVNLIYKPGPNKMYDRTLPLVTESFRRLREMVRRQGARLVVFIMPDRRAYGDRVGVYDHLVKGIGPILKRLDLDRPQREISKVLTGLGIDHLDLTPSLRRLGRGARHFNFGWDTHVNAAGHAFIARVMFDHLQQKGYLGFLAGAGR